ncbi:hypothetical protein PIB30_000993 [Stylosanthes scabra]|uniref:Uncharacterized protein n=1 Tax=Stylosanthes scabra TaxID=79078 RepID=A0ABU6T254_9FABA|nr:hypothetical protein [Stylosanthes scabra]
MITFSSEEIKETTDNRNQPLVIFVVTINTMIRRVFVDQDQGSSVDILFRKCFDALGLTEKDLEARAVHGSGQIRRPAKPYIHSNTTAAPFSSLLLSQSLWTYSHGHTNKQPTHLDTTSTFIDHHRPPPATTTHKHRRYITVITRFHTTTAPPSTAQSNLKPPQTAKQRRRLDAVLHVRGSSALPRPVNRSSPPHLFLSSPPRSAHRRPSSRLLRRRVLPPRSRRLLVTAALLEAHADYLVRYPGKRLTPDSFVTLWFTIGNSPDARNMKVRELVVSHNSAYNEILGRPTMYKVGAIMTTSILTKKFITNDGEI